MAKLINGMLSGTLGGVVYVNSKKYGPHVRSRPSGPWRRTPARLHSDAVMASVASHWCKRTKKQDANWKADGKKVNLSSFHRFCQVNYHRVATGKLPVMDPPEPKKGRCGAVARR